MRSKLPNSAAVRGGFLLLNGKMHLNYTTKSKMPNHPIDCPLSKKPKKIYRTGFVIAHRACKTNTEHGQLELIEKAGWTEAELYEYARVYYFRNAKDYPTATSYRRAIADVAKCYTALPDRRVRPSDHPHWLRNFRKAGSKSLPPRREALLKRGRGNGPDVSYEEYAWPDHTEEYRSMIEQRCRDFFKNIPPDQPVHPNAWAASHRAYLRELEAKADAARIAREAVTLVLSPKSLKKSKIKKFKTKVRRRRIVSSYDMGSWYETLKPHFNYEFPGHSPAFLEEVAVLARKDRSLRPDAPISPLQWKITCNKRYVLVVAP